MFTQGLFRGSNTSRSWVQQSREWMQMSGFQITVISPLVYFLVVSLIRTYQYKGFGCRGLDFNAQYC